MPDVQWTEQGMPILTSADSPSEMDLKDQDDQVITDKASICNLPNPFFFSVFNPISSGPTVLQARETFPARAQPDPNFSIDDVVTIDKVFAKLKNLNSDKSSGVDRVATHPLKMCAETLAGPLTLIFKKSIESSTLPTEWKEANVSPIFKRGSRTSVGNYRPVSLTSVPCKVLESLIKD